MFFRPNTKTILLNFQTYFTLLTLNFLLVDNLSDSRLADYRNIPDAQLVRDRGLFVAEGRIVVRRLLTESTLTPKSVLVTESARQALADALESRAEVPVFVATPPVMNGIAGFNIHRGCLAVGERPEPRDWQELARGARLIVLLERVANADNVGAVFRNAAAFGADAVLLDEPTTDPLYRKSIRTSMGAALVMPFGRVASVPDVIDELRQAGFATVAMTPSASALPLPEVVEAAAARPVAIVLGHEGEGLTEASLEACEFHARIPISSDVDSLNVATASAVALYEFNGGGL
jgi:tRNA G18 (ribose-2'-O)-methylase SpoU